MLSKAVIGIVTLSILIFYTSCKKEYSCEGCIPKKAVFSIICDSFKVNGSYEKDKPLNSSHTVQFLVNVDSAGVYSVSTNAINGMSFSGTGTLNSTGVQTIVLQGAGLPTQAGNFFFGIDSCSFPVTVTDQPKIDTFYYEGLIDGQFYTSSTVNGYLAVSSNTTILGAKDTTRFIARIEAPTPRPANATELWIAKGWYVDYANATQAQFKAFFNPGNYNYGNPLNITTPVVHGVAVRWIDQNGKNWDSDPSTNQTGRTFTIVSVTDYGFTPLYRIRVTATFNCKLYDGLGNQKTLTNGKFIGLFSM